jgi:predicted RNA binding protein YcfA (HicA-like mRNA interferase family)
MILVVPTSSIRPSSKRRIFALSSTNEGQGVLKLLEEDGWYLARTNGSHRQLKNSNKPGTVTVSGKPSIDVPPGTLNSILKQAGLKKERQ